MTLTHAELLLQLHDIDLPAEPTWWPPAIGWWVSGALLVLFIVIATLAFLRWRAAAPLRAAMREISQIKDDFSQRCDNHLLLNSCSLLLRKSAIYIAGRQQVASLTGKAWLAWLDQFSKSCAFTNGVGEIFADGHFRPTAEFDPLLLLELTETTLISMLRPANRKRYRLQE